jgi:predicted nuclease of predicted toxin-antitoxin system
LKFLLDNNLPPALARALNELTKGAWTGEHIVTHLRDKFSENTPDEAWIVSRSEESDWVVIL